MKITVTGSLGNISKPLATQLVKAGHQVTIISSSPDKAEAIKALGAIPAIGSVDDVAFLTGAFKGADAIYTMVPNNFSAANYRQYIGGVGENYAEAIKAAGVAKVVNLSSIGAHIDGGTGPISGIHDVEQTYRQLDGVAIKHLRPAFFYTNLLGNIDMIKHLGFLGANYGDNSRVVLVHPNDIAEVAAEELQSNFTGTSVRYISSDDRTTNEIASVLGVAIGKPDLKWVDFTDEQALQGIEQAGLPAEIARNYVEMGTAVKSAILWEDYDQHKPAQFGKTKLEDFAVEFGRKFNG
ncbi:NmrA family NAD(P)-binding protein [Mucilaginibacter rigui]|uniref:NmrA family NAD(P)-binding protein n=1 Tax=Mucilaginibacter rigui TaxID=534635 RepID=A0ABR7X129_9SPHI|nr:NAD(P)H-binding protein [Mucilaginibacter rigui]MBD1384279.1 NmrA family NAD(P)-binding protein [Mucilaginibacter rigui]